MVDSALAKKTKEASPNAYLGAQTQKVDQETTAANPGLANLQKPAQPARQRTESEKTGEAKRQINVATKGPDSGEMFEKTKLSKFGLEVLPRAPSGGHGGTTEEAPGEPELVRPAGLMGGEYIKGLKQGEFSSLNTREFVFYSYFQRIRERLDRAWVPILRSHLVKMVKSGRTIASEMDYRTKILVYLSPYGEILRVQVIQESGTRDLDDAAVKAFNRAGPFPNPPKGLIGTAKEIKIPWEFILKT